MGAGFGEWQRQGQRKAAGALRAHSLMQTNVSHCIGPCIACAWSAACTVWPCTHSPCHTCHPNSQTWACKIVISHPWLCAALQEAARFDHTEVVKLLTGKGGCIFEDDKVPVRCTLTVSFSVSVLASLSWASTTEPPCNQTPPLPAPLAASGPMLPAWLLSARCGASRT